MEIKSLSKLNSNEKTSIKQLVFICNTFDKSKNILFLSNEFNAYDNMNCFFLYYDNDDLLGVLSVYADTKNIAEISAYVLPSERQKGIFNKLYKTACQELKKFNYDFVHFKTEERFLHRQEIANKLNAILVDTEYLMEYDKFNNLLSSKKVTDLITRKALKEDFPALIYVQVQAFEESYDLSETYVKQSFYDEDTYLYTTILDGEVVGTCSVDISGANNLIFGLCVIPTHQHQGIGSQMLKNIINDILKTNEKPITICVESENKTALRLYSSSGFNIISQYEYYQTKI